MFTAADAVAAADEGRDVILVRPFTDAEDVAGFHAAKGILTSEGGKASHAALVARGMGRPAVVGADAIAVDLVGEDDHASTGPCSTRATGSRSTAPRARDDRRRAARRGDASIDNFEQVLEWADELRALGVRANADTPYDARRARELGAEGIGLCRTEHMFMAEDRQPKMRAMIMADTREARRAALGELLPLQQEDFEGLFEAMAGLPVTIRLLDPPLHEFLPEPRRTSPRRSSTRGCERGAPTCPSSSALTGPRAGDLRGEPDARHARLPARDPVPRDLRDAGPRDPARGQARCRSRRIPRS